jgi:tetratricopeptide (TPR) repeat protein
LIPSLTRLTELFREEAKYDKATVQAQRIVDILEKLEPNSSTLALSLNNLAILYREQGDESKVEDLLKRAITISQSSNNNAELSNDLNNLARFYREHNKYSEAEPLYKQSLSLRQNLFGPNDPKVAASLRNYAVLLRQMGRTEEAENLDKQAMAIEAKEVK